MQTPPLYIDIKLDELWEKQKIQLNVINLTHCLKMLWLLSSPEGHFQLNFQRPLKGLPIVPTIHSGIHSNAHSSCMANELHEVAKKKEEKKCKRSAKKKKAKKRNMADGQKSQKRTHTQKPQPAVALRFRFPSRFALLQQVRLGSTQPYAGLWLPKRAQRESHRHADSSVSLTLPPIRPSTLSLFFAPVVFQVTPWHKMEKVIENDLKSKAVSVANDCTRLSSWVFNGVSFSLRAGKCVEFHKYIKGFAQPS